MLYTERANTVHSQGLHLGLTEEKFYSISQEETACPSSPRRKEQIYFVRLREIAEQVGSLVSELPASRPSGLCSASVPLPGARSAQGSGLPPASASGSPSLCPFHWGLTLDTAVNLRKFTRLTHPQFFLRQFVLRSRQGGEGCTQKHNPTPAMRSAF